MKQATYSAGALGLAFIAALPCAPAQAQLPQTFVSAGGLDSNTCDRSTPCRTFAGALARTNAGGAISVLDPADFGQVTINKSISIVNDGAGAAVVLVPSGNIGITVAAGLSGVVNLRGLIVEGAGVGVIGIRLNTAKSLTIENCVIRNVTAYGLEFRPNTSASLAVSKTLLADSGGQGVYVAPTGNVTVKAVFNRVEFYGNTNDGLILRGVGSTGTISATVTDSVFANNGGSAVNVFAGAADAQTSLMLVRSTLANNGSGITPSGVRATVRVGQSTVTGHAAGWLAPNGAVLRSYGDNNIDGNASNQGPQTLTAQK
jgi:Right handed beta helix region